ncbi:MAG TPA: PAS domain S-box protein, partial [Methanomicrobiales archaeon]|nr:PAS domain S-box protein [Methanomicrobiales archaeon]
EGVVTRPEYAAYRDENEDLFRFLVDNAMDAMVILAWDGTILFTNRAGASMVGLNSPEEVIGRSILSFLHPDTVPQARRDLELVRLGWGGLGFPVEYRLRTTRGDAKWVEGLGKKITYHGSSADLILLRDITARKHAEEKAEMIRTMGLYGQMGEKRRLDLIQLVLSLSTRFLHISLEDIEGGLKSAISALGLFTAADRASLVIIPGEIRSLPRTYGWTAMGIRPSKSLLSDLCGDRFIWLKDRLRRGEVISIPDTGSLPEEALAEKEALATGGVRAILVAPLISNSHLLGCIGLESLRHPRHWTEEECLLLRLAGETFTYALERNRAEEGLRESEHRFRALIEKTSDFIMILDREGTMVFASPPIEWIDGFTPESLVGRSAFEMIAPDGVEGARRFLKDLLSHPGISSTFDTHFQGPHGMHYIEAVVTNLLDDPYVRGIVVNGRDVTYRKQAEAALHESEEKYRKLVELAADGILVHCEGKIVYVNPAGLHLLGAVSPDEVVG